MSISINERLSALHRSLGRSRTVTRWAALIRNQMDAIIKYHFAESFYTCEISEALLLKALSGSVHHFIDVGANVGNWTQQALEILGPDARGLAFEPGTAALTKLREKLKNVSLVEVIPYAVSDYLGTATFFEAPNAGEDSTLTETAAPKQAQKKTVTITTIPEELAKRNLTSTDLVKIDTEGNDLNVIRGMIPLLKELQVGVIQFEYNSCWLDSGNTLKQALSLFKTYNYEVYLLTIDGLHPPNFKRYGEYFSYSNYVAASPTFNTKLQSIVRNVY